MSKLCERILGGPAPVAPPRPGIKPGIKPGTKPGPMRPRPQPVIPDPWRRRENLPQTPGKACAGADYSGHVYAEAQEFLKINGFTEFAK